MRGLRAYNDARTKGTDSDEIIGYLMKNTPLKDRADVLVEGTYRQLEFHVIGDDVVLGAAVNGAYGDHAREFGDGRRRRLGGG